jgi:hypothetical protein
MQEQVQLVVVVLEELQVVELVEVGTTKHRWWRWRWWSGDCGSIAGGQAVQV